MDEMERIEGVLEWSSGFDLDHRPRLARAGNATWSGTPTAPVRRVASSDLVTRWGRQVQKKSEMLLLLNGKTLSRRLEWHGETLV